MKVKCIKTQLENNYGTYKAKDTFDDVMDIGDEFFVYGLEFDSKYHNAGVYIYLYPKMDHLVWIPLELFEIIDNKIPDCWEIEQYPNNNIAFYADILLQDDFLENFSEYEPKERAEFQAFKKIYEK